MTPDDRPRLAALLFAVAAILVVDLLLAASVVEACAVLVPVLLAAGGRSLRAVRVVASAAAAAVVLGILTSPGRASLTQAVAERSIVLAVLAAFTWLTLGGLRRERERATAFDHYRILSEASADAFVTIDAGSRILDVNRAAERMFGWSAAELIGRDLTTLMPERLRAAHLQGIGAFLQTGRRGVPWEGVELVALRRDGHEIPVEISFGHVVSDGEHRFAGVVRDISERRSAREQVVRSQDDFESLVNSIDGIVWQGAPGTERFTFVSSKAENILGYPVERWLAEPTFWRDHIHPEDRERAIEFCARQTAERKDHTCEYRMIAADGRVVWLRDIVSVVTAAERVLGVRGIMVDITQRMQAEAALEESEQRFRTVVTNAPIVLFAVDRHGVITLSDGRGLEALGLRPGEAVGKSLYELYPDVPAVHLNIRRALLGETFEDTVIVGDTAWQTHHAPLCGPDGTVTGVIGVATDVSEHWRAEQALRESETRYALAVQGSRDGIWDWNLRDNQYYFSPRWKAMIGHAAGDIGDRGEEWFGRVHPDDLDRLRVAIRNHLDAASERFDCEYRLQHRDGTYRWMLAQGIAVSDDRGSTYRMAGSQTDITERKLSEQQLVHNAFRDALTGLPNRALFVEHLERALARTQGREGYIFSVLFIDIDRLKVVNDSLGHLAGDQLLVEFSRRLLDVLRPGDLAARFGGDEFAVLVDDIKDVTEASLQAERIQGALRPGFDLGTQEVFATASIGISVSSPSTDRPEDLMRDADTAMYRAKALGGARHVVFQRAMHQRAVALLQLETDLRRSLSRGDLRIQIDYQPIVALDSGRIGGFEALGRWRHPQRGLVSPVEFIPVAEQTGLIIPIGRWMLQEACQQMRAWQSQFVAKPALTISVNFSSKQLLQPDLIQQIEDVLRESGLEPASLSLEITESVLVDSAESAAALFLKLKGMQVKLQLDDFGTGYSSLSYLLRFPLDTLKIDRAFVTHLEDGTESREIVRTIVTLAHHLKMNVVAEGVETAGQLRELRALGCHYAQGYFFSRPMTVEAATALIAANPRW